MIDKTDPWVPLNRFHFNVLTLPQWLRETQFYEARAEFASPTSAGWSDIRRSEKNVPSVRAGCIHDVPVTHVRVYHVRM